MSKLKYLLFWPFVIFACIGSAKDTKNLLLRHAVYCLEVKGFLPSPKSKKLEFGYFLDEESYPKEKVLYVVNYLNPKNSNGTVFTIFLAYVHGHSTFSIQNNAAFTLPQNRNGSVVFVTPPLGGIWTQEHLASSIKIIEKEPRIAIEIRGLLSTHPSIDCGAYTDPQPNDEHGAKNIF